MGTDGDSLITGVGYKQNTHSDSAFCKENLESRPEHAEAETLIADGAYGGHENHKLANAKNTELVTTALTGIKPDPILGEFELSPDGLKVLKCPMNHAPIKSTYYPKTGVCRALFPVNCCENCPNRDACRVKPQRKNYAVHISATMVERAKFMEALSTDEYRQLTRQRNAIEGIPSVLRRKYHVDDIPVFGHLRSKQFFMFKICAYNFNKLLKHNRKIRGKSALKLEIA